MTPSDSSSSTASTSPFHSSNLTRSTQAKSESPTPSLTNLKIEDNKSKTRHELFMDQLRIREEYKKHQRENALRAKEVEKVKIEVKIEQKEKEVSDDDIIIDEEMTNKNVCIGMVKTDIVVEKSPLILIRDEQYEIVSLESEGKLNTENYSFKVTSRSQPPRFVRKSVYFY